MSTWISKALLFGGAAAALSACSDGAAMSFAQQGGAAPASLFSVPSGKKRMAQTSIAGGDITLAVPDGYCIDKRTLRRSRKGSFAMVARCDSLGVDGFFDVFSLALITITTQPLGDTAKTPSPAEVARSAAPAKVLTSSSRSGVSLARLASGPHKIEGVSQTHWRAATAIGGHMIALSLYAPKGSPALDGEGADLLVSLSNRTRKASKPAPTTGKTVEKDAGGQRKSPFKAIAGLFE